MTNATSNNAATHAWGGWLAGLARARGMTSPTCRLSPPACTLLARLALSNGVRIATLVIVVGAAVVVSARVDVSAPGASMGSPTLVSPSSTLAEPALASAAFVPTLARPTLAPPTLAQTGLYADWATKTLASDVLPFAPQYPLWSDGARKQRWISVPAAIDARDADAWVFPVGTRVWKQFSFGTRTETRFIHRTEAGWQYATYVWNGDAATLAPAGADVPIAGGVHRVPSETDCRPCHANGASPVLSFSALQLSLDRDPNAPHISPRDARAALDRDRAETNRRNAPPSIDHDHAETNRRNAPPSIDHDHAETNRRKPTSTDRDHVDSDHCLSPVACRLSPVSESQDVDLLSLVIAGFVIGLDDLAPRIPGPPLQRAALGYLHGNCGGCHRSDGPLAGLDLVLAHGSHGSAVVRTTANVPSRFGAPLRRITPGDAEQSVLIARMRARHSPAQMPPIGTDVIDAEALRLVADWIDQLADNQTGE